jgi:hypothetical protein
MKENPLTMEMLLDQLAGLNIIQLAIPLILLVIVDSYHYSKKRLLRQFRHHISYVYRTYKCGYLRCIKNRNGIILFFYNVVPWSIPREWWAYVLCIIALDFFRYWSHRLTHVNRFGGQLMLHITIQKI